MSTFFSTLDLVDTSGSRQPQNEHALPLPEDVSAAFRTLGNTYAMMMGGSGDASSQAANELLQQMQEMMMQASEDPPRKVNGVSDEFLAELDRVPKKSLKQGDSCPICANPFLDGQSCLAAYIIWSYSVRALQTHIPLLYAFPATTTTSLTLSALLHG